MNPSHRRLGAAALALSMLASITLGGCASAPPPELMLLTEQVRAAETAFAASMAARDFTAFGGFVADDATFVNGAKPVLRGKAAVLTHWERFFRAPQAPFAWKPEIVEVLSSGNLAYSEGPVSLPDGRVVARYFSTWRREPDGRWRVVLDNGYDVCDCKKP